MREVMGLSLLCRVLCAIAVFLFGITLLGDGLNRAAGGRIAPILRRVTDNRMGAFLTGAAITAVVQSSAAVGVLTAELVQSGILTLRRAIPILIGANVGTTATAWLLCVVRDLPYTAVISTVLAVVGMACYLIPIRRHWGSMILGLFLVLTGMESVTAAVEPLMRTALLHRLCAVAQQPLWGLLCGMLLTVLLQSSSVSVGLLQALAFSGQISYAMAIPVVMGQNIGTCLTVFFVSLGGKRRAGQVAWAHLLFNGISAAIIFFLIGIVKLFHFTDFLSCPVGFTGIAMLHTAFNLTGAAVFLPLSDRFASLIGRVTARP